MIFERKFTLQTDHKPLTMIFGKKKGVPVYTANRLQRWAFQLLAYDFEIEYVRTSEFGHADMLSRLINNYHKPEEDFIIASVTMEEDISTVLQDSLQFIPITFSKIKLATEQDTVLQQVIAYTIANWPTSVAPHSDLKPFFNRKEALSVVQNCLLFKERLVISAQYRGSIPSGSYTKDIQEWNT